MLRPLTSFKRRLLVRRLAPYLHTCQSEVSFSERRHEVRLLEAAAMLPASSLAAGPSVVGRWLRKVLSVPSAVALAT